MNTIIKTFQKKNVGTIPIWLMRQAGRYLPEYMSIRKNFTSFLDLCYNIDKATEITLQPIERFNFDAAIVFSDILVLPDSLGWEVSFQEGTGPSLRQFKTKEDLKLLQKSTDPRKIGQVYEIISKVRAALLPKTCLIGFVGGAWTVVSYMLEGKGKHDFLISKKFIYENERLANELIDFIADKTAIHLFNQARAGSNMLQIFESHAGSLSAAEYNKYVIAPTKKIVSYVKKQFPNVPIIGFPRGSGLLYEKYIEETGIDGIGVDQFVPVSAMKKWQEKILVQGNLDPVTLLTEEKVIATKVDEIILNLGSENFIFNLGHGVLPNTPVKNIEFLVEYVRQAKR